MMIFNIVATVSLAIVFLIGDTKSDAKCQGSIVDLSYGYDEATPSWPTTKPFVFTKRIAKVDEEHNYWYALNEFCVSEHGGTHLDAPYHFSKTGWKVGEIPLENLINKGIFIDLSEKTAKLEEKATLEKSDLEQWELENNATIPENAIVLVHFNWAGQHFGRDKYFHGDASNSTLLAFPGISPEAARFLAFRKIAGIGLDTPSVDPASTTHYETHRILAENNIYGMENVKTATCLPSKDFTVVALPMHIIEGTGGPLRVVAIVGADIVKR